MGHNLLREPQGSLNIRISEAAGVMQYFMKDDALILKIVTGVDQPGIQINVISAQLGERDSSGIGCEIS